MTKWWIWLALFGSSAFLAFFVALLIVIGQNPHNAPHSLLVYGP